MNELEFTVLDELYFVNSFYSLQQETTIDSNQLIAVIKGLLSKKYVTQLVFSKLINDYIKLDAPDYSKLTESYFVATKEGLLAHNTRS
jgi:hypothetical protein